MKIKPKELEMKTTKTMTKKKSGKPKAGSKKSCRDCKKSKPTMDFCTNNAMQDGLHSRCKVCEQKYRDTLKTGGMKKVAKKKATKKTAVKKKATKKSVVKRLPKKTASKKK